MLYPEKTWNPFFTVSLTFRGTEYSPFWGRKPESFPGTGYSPLPLYPYTFLPRIGKDLFTAFFFYKDLFTAFYRRVFYSLLKRCGYCKKDSGKDFFTVFSKALPRKGLTVRKAEAFRLFIGFTMIVEPPFVSFNLLVKKGGWSKFLSFLSFYFLFKSLSFFFLWSKPFGFSQTSFIGFTMRGESLFGESLVPRKKQKDVPRKVFPPSRVVKSFRGIRVVSLFTMRLETLLPNLVPSDSEGIRTSFYRFYNEMR